MKNFTQELKNIMTEDPGIPIMSPDELRARSQTIVILTNSAPDELLALAGPDRKATLLSINPPMITLPYQKGVFKVRPEDIVFENHHTGRDVTEAGGEETPYEKFFAGAMKKFGVDSPIELSPDETKKFFNYVDKNWEAEEETDEDTTEDVSTGKVGKKDKGSYQHAYKLALKKYQIHSADELDTPEERKGFTDYVDRLWKKGDIHRDKKEASFGQGFKAGFSGKKPDDKDANDKKDDDEKKEKKKPGFLKKTVGKYVGKEASIDTDEAKPGKPPKPGNLNKPKKKKPGLPKKSSFASKLKGTGLGKVVGAAKSQMGKYTQKNASIPEASSKVHDEFWEEIPEGVKKSPGVSKKAQGAVGFAKHARKGTGAKRQFQKGVRQAGKKQARDEGIFDRKGAEQAADDIRASMAQQVATKLADRNEVSPPDRKHQVKGIKKHMSQKKGKDKIAKTYVDKKTGKRKETNPWALAWAQYDKYGVPSRIEKD